MKENHLKLLKLGGPPYEIGYHHGKEGKEGIKDFLNRILQHGKEFIPELTQEKAFEQVKFYIPFIEAYAPHLADEIRGIEGVATTTHPKRGRIKDAVREDALGLRAARILGKRVGEVTRRYFSNNQ